MQGREFFSGKALKNNTKNASPALSTPPKRATIFNIVFIKNQFIFIKTIIKFIMASAEKSQEASVGSPAPRQKDRATVDTLR
jgi:hypothetical protein